MKGFVLGFLLALAVLAGTAGAYFGLGIAPAAAGDPPMPFEKTVARMALRARISKQPPSTSPVPADEANLLSGGKIYAERCASCHGLPGQAPPEIGARMYPPATALFKGKGVTDDPVSESYWKVANGIRLTGMPAFKSMLNDQQLWQLSQLVTHATQLPESVKQVLR